MLTMQEQHAAKRRTGRVSEGGWNYGHKPVTGPRVSFLDFHPEDPFWDLCAQGWLYHGYDAESRCGGPGEPQWLVARLRLDELELERPTPRVREVRPGYFLRAPDPDPGA